MIMIQTITHALIIDNLETAGSRKYCVR